MGNRWKGQTLESRFWQNVKVGVWKECWLWTARVNRAGYGMASLGGRNLRASRVSYAIHNNMSVDDIGELHVLHTCDNPICVNPDHLFLGTNADKVAKGRGKEHRAFKKPESYKKGEDAHDAKLTNEIVIVCRLARNRYGASISHLARKYKVSSTAMSNAIHGKTFRNIKEGLEANG